jgi:hypothetical protein
MDELSDLQEKLYDLIEGLESLSKMVFEKVQIGSRDRE